MSPVGGRSGLFAFGGETELTFIESGN